MKKICLALFALLAIGVQTKAQDQSAKILDQVAQFYAQEAPILSEFTLQQNPTMGNFMQTSKGSLLTKQNKFMLEMGDILAWFNGTSLWTFNAAHEEVEVREPSQAEVNAINPTLLFGNWRKNFKAVLECKEKLLGGEWTYLIKLTAITDELGMKTVDLWVNEETNLPNKLIIKLEDAQTFGILFRNITVAKNLLSESFEFPSKEYPDAEIIDLR